MPLATIDQKTLDAIRTIARKYDAEIWIVYADRTAHIAYPKLGLGSIITQEIFERFPNVDMKIKNTPTDLTLEITLTGE